MTNWFWRSLPLESHTGSEVFAKLFLNQNPIATLLESPDPAPQPQLSRYSICAGSPRLDNQGRPQLWTPRVGKILPFLKTLLAKSQQKKEQNFLPFQGGWLGWLGYELAWEIEKLPELNNDPLPFPVAYWYEPASFAVLDHLQQTLWLAASKP
ncbi:MAG: anthranilate synthase component I, partial [Spirulinaceae cyanobacterium]